MTSYSKLIRQDVVHHESFDASLWPSYVSDFAQLFQNEWKIPSWFERDLVERDNVHVTDLCDGLDSIMDGEIEQRLRAVFHTALADCARIRAVVETENLSDTLYPKESFLVILVRNIILKAYDQLSSLEDVPVILPRHAGGEHIPLLKFMKKTFYAPLVVSIDQEMPVEENESDPEKELSDANEDNSKGQIVHYSPLSMSAWLKRCDTPRTPEEDSDEQEQSFLSPTFEAHFLAYPPSPTPPSVCHIPVLCMADEEQLPVLLSSLLYQRRVWRIKDPLVGLGFSKYDTTIKLFVGWLEDDIDISSSFDLPRVHVGEMKTPIMLDLSSPLVALAISRFLCSLEPHIRGIRDAISHSVGAVISDSQSDQSISWRIDTADIRKDSALILENNNIRIIDWLKNQGCPGDNDMVKNRRQGAGKALSSSTASSSTTQGTSSAQGSIRTPPSSYPPGVTSSSNVNTEGLDGKTTTRSQKSCSAFAATGGDDYQVFRWMFDCGVIPQPIVNDPKFRDEYSVMTGLIWPETWNSTEDLPWVDPSLKPCTEELLESISALKKRPDAIRCIPAEGFPFNMRVLEHSFSAIFQASRWSREKVELREPVCEAAWRHDHDRLLFDFFIRLVQPGKMGDTIQSLIDRYSVAKLEDPVSRPTLETTLRLPKSEDMKTADRDEVIYDMLRRESADLKDWLHSRGCTTKVTERGHSLHAQNHFFLGRLQLRQKRRDWQLLVRHRLKRAAVNRFQLVSRSSTAKKEAPKVKHALAEKTSRDQSSSRKGKISALDAAGPSVAITETTKTTHVAPTPYTMPSSSMPTSMLFVDARHTNTSKTVEELADRIERLHFDAADAPRLELPILVAEYKKADEQVIKGTNQLRMYLTACVKFLQTIGITDFPVYGVQTDGPIVALPAAVLRDDNFIYLYERLTEKLDISTPVGAWHYATILCRLAQNHAKLLEQKFAQVRDRLIASLQNGDQMESWTMIHQLAQWEAAGDTLPRPKGKTSDKSDAAVKK